ncbi:aspartyl protease family protein [Brevundimonas sp. FT23042]|uniref:aspartyl protease family protein n=1 Tax=Brevundimonas sp. FT23042 TaxID=3393749 RepID=UPI003B588ED8
MKRLLVRAACAVALLTGLPSAAQADDPAGVLDRYRQWRGGAAFEALRSVSAEGEMAVSGLSGPVRSLATAGGDMRVDVDLGVVRTTSSRHGEDRWTLTQSGQLEPLAPTAAEDLRRDALLMFEDLLDDPARLDRKADVTRDGQTLAVIAVDFGDADVHELMIDPETGALYGLREVRDRRETFIRYEDWRMVEGVRMPFTETVVSAEGSRSVTRWREIDANPGIAATAFDRPTVAAAHVIADGAVSTGWMPFQLIGGTRVYLPATVNGTPSEVLLDSGAEMTVLDKGFAEQLGLAVTGEVAASGTGGVGTAQFARHVNIDLGGIRFVDRTVAVIDLAQISQALGRPLTVILGKDAFNALVIDLDFAAQTIAFHEVGSFVAPEGATELALTSTGTLRAVALSIEGRSPALFDLDTGNGSALLIYPAYAQAEGLLRDRPSSTVMAGAVGGIRESGIATIRSLDIGGFVVRDVPAVFPPAGPSAVDSDRTVGNVGMGVLARFRLITDFDGGRMWLAATPEALAQPFGRDRLGLGLRKTPDRLVAQRISPRSPASDAGLTDGAVITAVNGVPATALTPDVLRTLVTGPAGRTVVLTLEGGETRTLESRDFY